MRTRSLVSFLVLLAVPAFAQVEVPRASPHSSVSQTIGTTEITVDYHRPGVKGRQIWGGLVPYDQPWRMGANEATTIEFSDPVTIGGSAVPAGKYSFFAIPARDEWTLILNKDPEQWGAYGYDQSKDQLRLKVKPVAVPVSEWMGFTIDPTSTSSAVVTMNWAGLAVPMNVSVDVPELVWADVDAGLKKAMMAQAQTYGAAAGWALESGQRLDEGLQWIDRSIAIQENVFNTWTKAQLLHKLGRSAEAVPVMEKSLELARAGNMPADFMGILNRTMEQIREGAE